MILCSDMVKFATYESTTMQTYSQVLINVPVSFSPCGKEGALLSHIVSQEEIEWDSAALQPSPKCYLVKLKMWQQWPQPGSCRAWLVLLSRNPVPHGGPRWATSYAQAFMEKNSSHNVLCGSQIHWHRVEYNRGLAFATAGDIKDPLRDNLQVNIWIN